MAEAVIDSSVIIAYIYDMSNPVVYFEVAGENVESFRRQ